MEARVQDSISMAARPPEPYVGLKPYTEAERELFFGRKRDAELLINKIFANALTLLYAPSGVGKTSLLRTLVIPGLAAEEAHVVYFDHWGDAEPYGLLRATVEGSLPPSEPAVEAPADADLAEVIRVIGDRTRQTVVLILDQFEEFLQRHAGALDPLREKLGALMHRKLDVRLVLSFREEFLASVDACFRYQILTLFGSTYHLEHLDAAQAAEAIVEPAKRYERTYDPALLDQLLKDLQPQTGNGAHSASMLHRSGIELPFLQIICRRLWQEPNPSGEPIIALATYRALGGREGIITDYLNGVTAGLSRAQKLDTAEVFRWLAPQSGMKVAYPLDVLEEQTRLPKHRIRAVLEHLEKHRIVRARDAIGGSSYELYHDAFINILRPWREKQFRERYVQRMLLGAGAVVLVSVLVSAATVAFWRAQERIVRSQDLAQEAQALLTTNPVNALKKAVDAATTSETQQAHDALRRALSSLRERSPPLERGSTIVAAAFGPDGKRLAAVGRDGTAQLWDVDADKPFAELTGHTGKVTDVAYSPKGEWVATASADRNVRVFDADGRLIRTLSGHEQPVQSVAFDASGKLLLSASQDWTARIWDIETGTERRKLDKHEGDVIRAQFTPDGQRIVTVAADGEARVWGSEGGVPIQTINLKADVLNAALSPNGKHLVTMYADDTASIWHIDSLSRMDLLGHNGPVLAATFSPDGERVVTVGVDNTAKVWDAHTGKLIADLLGHPSGEVSWAAFHVDRNQVVTASTDKTVQFWDIAGGTVAVDLPERIKRSGSKKVVPSPDAELAATISANRVSVWRLSTGERIDLAHTRTVDNVAFSADGKQLVTLGADNTARVWDLTTKQETAKLEGHQEPLLDAAFSRDGKLVATASADRTARVWETGSGKQLAELKGHEGYIYAIVFSPDGKLVATASADKTVRVWDLAQQKSVAQHNRHQGTVSSVEFSGDGRRVLTASAADRTAKVWDWVADPSADRIVKLDATPRAIQRARFSPDGNAVVTVTTDGTAQIWKVNGEPVSDLRGESGAVTYARFSADGRQILALSSDRMMAFPCEIWCRPPKDLLDFARTRLKEVSEIALTATTPNIAKTSEGMR